MAIVFQGAELRFPMWRHRLLICCLLGALAGCDAQLDHEANSQRARLRLAVTTSTRDSGLLDELLPIFEYESGTRVDVLAVGTGAALKLGEDGEVDAVLVHAREAEDAFMAAGHGVRREDVMYNRFVILGPADDPAKVRESDAAVAFGKLADSQQRFVSRGDQSGTHKREHQLWQSVGRTPAWDGYIESGQGMGATLTMADQMQAYVLTDEGTYLRFKDKIDLVPLVTSSSMLYNPYGAMVVNPDKHDNVAADRANAFVDFLISPETQQRIRDFQICGRQLFFPMRLPSEGQPQR